MKTITKYQAEDGTEFSVQADCEQHEAWCAEAKALTDRLAPLPADDDCAFANGSGYIQQDRETFNEVRIGLLKLANRIFPHKWFEQSIASEHVDPSWASRIIGECCAPAWKGWNRISCTDDQYREWGQPYFRSHPEAAEQVQLN